MPVIVFHGTADTRVSPVNADQTIAQWSKTNACLAAEQAQSGFALTEISSAAKCRAGMAIKSIPTWRPMLSVAGKVVSRWPRATLWPGSPKPSKYADPKGPNASAEIWRFFCEASHSMASFSPGPRMQNR